MCSWTLFWMAMPIVVCYFPHEAPECCIYKSHELIGLHTEDLLCELAFHVSGNSGAAASAPHRAIQCCLSLGELAAWMLLWEPDLFRSLLGNGRLNEAISEEQPLGSRYCPVSAPLPPGYCWLKWLWALEFKWTCFEESLCQFLQYCVWSFVLRTSWKYSVYLQRSFNEAGQ